MQRDRQTGNSQAFVAVVAVLSLPVDTHWTPEGSSLTSSWSATDENELDPLCLCVLLKLVQYCVQCADFDSSSV